MNHKLLFFLTISVFFNSSLLSQTLTSNPFSYFGLGLIENNGFGENSATGSAGLAMPSSRNLNSTNPASYIGLDSTSFLFTVGLYGKNSKLESNNYKQTAFDANIKYIAFGMKLSKYWGAGVGLVPFSSRGYYISATYPVEGDLSEYRLISTGSGNLSRFYLSNSIRITKNLAVGINSSYLFGSLINEEELQYSDDAFNNLKISTTDYFKNFYFDFGLQYKFRIGKNDFYTGLTYNHSQSLHAEYKKLAVNGSDTLTLDEQGKHNFTIPQAFGIGFGTKLFDKQLKLLVDYKMAQWSKSNYHYKMAQLKDSWQINTGAEYSREYSNGLSYWDYVNFRLGYRFEKTYLSIKGNQINEKAITFGLGLPSKFDRTKINLSFEHAVVGSGKDALLTEKYNRIIIGITLSDKWFQRIKFE